MIRKPYFLIFLVFFGCNLAPKYQKPEMALSQNWKTSPAKTLSEYRVDHWWDLFEDKPLNQLIVLAIENNPTIFAAMQKVAETRAIATYAKSSLYPQINLNPNYENTGTLFKTYIPLPEFLGANSIFRAHELQYSLPLNLSYEIDLWGKLRNYYNASYINAQAQEQAMLVSILSLTTDIAKNYFQYQSLAAQIRYMEQIVQINRHQYLLSNERYTRGLTPKINPNEAEKKLNDLEADLEKLYQSKAQIENQIAYLVGEEPAKFSLESSLEEKEPPVVPIGLPSSLLQQRPDIIQAERNMAAANALIGVAKSSYFPSLSLTGALGFSSPDLQDFLKWKSRLWQIGADIAQTIFNAGRNKSKVLLARAYYLETTGNYKNTVLQALKEVEDALSNLEKQQKQYKHLSQAADLSYKNLQLSDHRYKAGLIPLINVIDTDTTLLQAQIEKINLLGIRYITTVELIKALGGRWFSEDAIPVSSENTN